MRKYWFHVCRPDHQGVRTRLVTSIFEWYARNLTALQTEIDSVAYRRIFCLGEVVLSEAPPLGTLQGHFPGRRWIETGEPLTLSDTGRLSDIIYGGHWLPIDEWLDQVYTATNALPAAFDSIIYAGVPEAICGAELIFDPQLADSRTDVQIGNIQILVDRTWTGAWDSQSWRTANRLPDISMTASVID